MISWTKLGQSAGKSLKEDRSKQLLNRSIERGCPTTKCTYVRSELLLLAARHAADTVVELRPVFDKYDIAADNSLRDEVLGILTDSIIKVGKDSAGIAMELCQSCMASSLLNDRDIQ